MNPQNLSINDFFYDLPEDRIAKYPLTERDSSKLLVYHEGKINEDIYRTLDQHIPQGSLLIFNNTKVIEARILFQKPTGGVIEIFCLEPGDHNAVITAGMMQKGNVRWQCMIGGASKWKHGQLLEKKIKSGDKEVSLFAKYVEKKTESFVIDFWWTDHQLSFAEVLHLGGVIPLPPYIKREPEKSDGERYQTIYAKQEGSVAAPTAGLHFTDDLLKRLTAKKIETGFITLHVGAGTFKPVKSETMKGHEMHAEIIEVSKTMIENILHNLPGNIIAVGTTTLRTIESLYWLGVKLKSGEENNLTITQWEPYELEKYFLLPGEALQTLINFMSKKNWEYLTMKTQVIIAPGYQAKIVKAMVTNFHQPRSTLLLLVASLIGDDWKKIYAYALENNFRFLSYGDGCLLWVNQSKQEPVK